MDRGSIGASRSTLRAAVAEAAFMTGLERNADIVVMASYAPLFANVNDRRWNPDLIYCDASRSSARRLPRQKLFAHNRPDFVHPVEVTVSSRPGKVEWPGRIGLGAWNTSVAVRNVRVTRGRKTLFSDDFSGGMNGGAPGAATGRPTRPAAHGPPRAMNWCPMRAMPPGPTTR